MFASVFNQVAPIFSSYLPIRTIQNIIDSGIIRNCDELLSSTVRYQLYIDVDQMRERLDQFKQSTEYLKSLPEQVTTYQIWDISLYDSFNDEEQSEIQNRNILDIVSMEKILTFLLLPQAEYFTTVQSKHDGMMQKINVWTKPSQINEYMDEIITEYNHLDGEEKEEQKQNKDDFLQFKNTATETWRTICHGIWSDDTFVGIMNKMKDKKSMFKKAKYYDWRPDVIPKHDLEFGNYYADDNDNIQGEYRQELKDYLVVDEFVENDECDIIEKWYGIDIETKSISTRLMILNSNLLCGVLKEDKDIVMKKKDEYDEEMSMMSEAAKKNNKRRNAKVKYGHDIKRHIVVYKFKLIVWKGRYKLKDEINSELAELEWLEKMGDDDNTEMQDGDDEPAELDELEWLDKMGDDTELQDEDEEKFDDED